MNGALPGQGAVYQLTVQSGTMPGATWIIGDTPLLIGRSQTCHVVLVDDLVSRTHCSVQRMGDGIRLRDLGSRNPSLLNGKPVSNAALNAGDRLAVGDTVFLISVIRPQPRLDQATPGKTDTLRLETNEVGLLRTVNAPDELRRLPQTARDYAALFQFGLECAACKDSASLRDRLITWLRQRFDCASVFLYERQGGELACTLQWPDNAAAPETDSLGAVTEDGRARLMRAGSADESGGISESMVCPLLLGGEPAALMTVFAPEGAHGYQREDLEFLMALAHVYTPYMSAVAEREMLRLSNEQLRAKHPGFPRLIGKSSALHNLRRHLQKASLAQELPVLLLGETGTGKELAARQIHLGSTCAEREMIVVNCAAIPDELFESEVFGHVRGAFTGASAANRGLVSQAHGSTLFLDEVAELSPANQAKLLRFAELGHYRRVGDSRERTAKVRIIAATNRPLPGDGFRLDLYHRLSGFVIELPPLRNRPDDIVPLAEYFRSEYTAPGGAGCDGFAPEALEAMRAYAWPGNVRELRLRIHRALRTAQGRMLSASDLFGIDPAASAMEESQPLAKLAEVERGHIARVLEACGGDTQRAAEILDIARSTVYKKISDYGLR